MDFELDIEKYTLEDLLALFHLTVQFDERDLKNARKSVLRLHPDKSHLDPTYFIFIQRHITCSLAFGNFDRDLQVTKIRRTLYTSKRISGAGKDL